MKTKMKSVADSVSITGRTERTISAITKRASVTVVRQCLETIAKSTQKGATDGEND